MNPIAVAETIDARHPGVHVLRTWTRDQSVNRMSLGTACEVLLSRGTVRPDADEIAQRLLRGHVLTTRHASFVVETE